MELKQMSIIDEAALDNHHNVDTDILVEQSSSTNCYIVQEPHPFPS
jgi:hypothetical protein